MSEHYEKYRECQNCKKVFVIPKLSSKNDNLCCTFCGNMNIAIITKKQYDTSYKNNLLRGNKYGK